MAGEKITGSISVFLLAENRLLREALAKVLIKKSEICVVADAGFSPEIVTRLAETRPRVLVVDSAVFGCAGVSVVTASRAEVPGLRVVMIGMDADKDVFLRCVSSGVTGYVLKEASAAEITAAVLGVACGEAICPPRLCAALFEYVAQLHVHAPGLSSKQQLGLTRREQQLVQMMSAGLTNKEIASQWNLSEQTIKNHVHHVLRKLGAGDRLTAVEFCRHEGLIAAS